MAPLSLTDTEITVALSNPLDEAAVKGVEFATARRATAVVATLSQIDVALAALSEDVLVQVIWAIRTFR